MNKYIFKLFILGVFLNILIGCKEKDIEQQADDVLKELSIDEDIPLNDLLDQIATHFDIPGIAAGVTTSNQILEAEAIGVIDSRSKETLTLEKDFDLNEVTKSFTAFIVMQLVEEDSLRLDEKLTDIFPELEGSIHEDYKEVRVIDLLKHQSGLSRDGEHIDSSEWPTLRGTLSDKRYQYMQWILSQPSNGTYGEFVYSNIGYVILGAIIEQASGNTFEREVRWNIYGPLRLYSGGFGWPVDFSQEYTYGHIREDGNAVPVRFKVNYLNLVDIPSGGIQLSAGDLTVYIKEQLLGLKGRSHMLSKEGFEKMHQIDGACGLGWFISTFPSFQGTESGGVGDGYRSEVFVSEELDLGIAVLANIDDDNIWLACKAVELALLRKYSKNR